MLFPSDWLGPLVEEELRGVIAWGRVQQARSRHDETHLSPRFSDDFSNFRSVLDAELLPTDANVQIQRVQQTSDLVTLSISDGFTSIKARLSASAVATLEAAMGEDLDGGTTNDVFAVRKATVVSCPIGLPEDHIQLDIDQVEYLFHLRKSIGQSMPIEQRKHAHDLIDEIGQLRTQQLNASIDGDDARSISSSSVTSQVNLRDGVQKTSPASIVSQPRVENNDRKPSSQQSPTPVTQLPFATQAPLWTKGTRPPTLEKDGVQWESGVNLSGPVAAPIQPVKRRRFSDEEEDEVTRNRLVNLQNLLRRPRAERRSSPPLPRSTPQRPPRAAPTTGRASTASTPEAAPLPEVDVNSVGAPVESSSTAVQEDAVMANTDLPSAAVRENENTTLLRTPSATRLEARAVAHAESSTAPVGVNNDVASSRIPSAVVERDTADAAAVVEEADTFASTSTKPIATAPCLTSRPRIPQDQRRLLDKPSSWFPSLPGHDFPHPNIPIDLLRRWNDLAKTQPRASLPVQPAFHEDSSDSADIEMSDAAPEPQDEVASEFEEELLDWSSSPPLPQPNRPPHSSNERSPSSSEPVQNVFPHTGARLPPAMDMPLDSSPPEIRASTYTADRVEYSPGKSSTSSRPSVVPDKQSRPKQSPEKVSATPLRDQIVPVKADGTPALLPNGGQDEMRMGRRSSRASSGSSVDRVRDLDHASSRVSGSEKKADETFSSKGVSSPYNIDGSSRPSLSTDIPKSTLPLHQLTGESKRPDKTVETMVKGTQPPAPPRDAVVNVEKSQSSPTDQEAAYRRWRREHFKAAQRRKW